MGQDGLGGLVGTHERSVLRVAQQKVQVDPVELSGIAERQAEIDDVS